MEIINFKQIIEQNFEKEKIISFNLSGKEAYIKIKKLDLLNRNKIDKIKTLGIVNEYDYEYDETGEAKVKKAIIKTTEEVLNNDEKILEILLSSIIEQNLKTGKMTIDDWIEFGTYYTKEFNMIIDKIIEFNGLKKNI